MIIIKEKLQIVATFFLYVVVLSCGNGNSEDIPVPIEPELMPKITSISPAFGPEGTAVTITGTGFEKENVEVAFNEKVSQEITFSSATQITAKVPTAATTGPVSVKNIGGAETSGPDFSVDVPLEAPEITGLSVNSGLEGTELTITGTNFGDIAANITISFNGRETNQIIALSSTEIFTSVPIGAISGPISVRIATKTVQGPDFTVETPENFKIAFFGDSNIGSEADAVLNLVKNEGADVVVHPGDLNYDEIPTDFESHINGILGADFPYFFGVGNHDDTVWGGSSGYQSFLEARFQRLGIPWKGRAGVQSSFAYQGIFFVSSAPDEFGISSLVAGNHVRDALSNVNSIWKVSFWHKNQRLMQIGGKSNEAGWDVYEESRKGGALIATGHEHSYSRTYEMSNFENQTISSTSDTINLFKDDPATDAIDEGRSFGFVSGLGGRNIRDAESGLDANPWWADVYHSDNGGQYGALFGEFNYNGDTSLARFYFKDIDGAVRDVFLVRSNN